MIKWEQVRWRPFMKLHGQQTYTVNGIQKRALQNRVNSR